MKVKYIAYEIENEDFNYVMNVDGVIVFKTIPLHINNETNVLALSIIEKVKKAKIKKDYKQYVTMSYMDFYHSISNPIDNPEVIKKIIHSYVYGDSFYSEITRINFNPKKIEKEINKDDKEKFYVTLFNMWKNTTIKYALKNGVEDKLESKLLIKRLKEIPDISSYKEYLLYINEKIINDAFVITSKEAPNWTSINSKKMNLSLSRKMRILDHRFYMNVNRENLYKFLNIFLEKCNKQKIPYDFKFDETCKRDDAIVVYTDTINLLKTAEILKDIIKENPSLFNSYNKAPILTGKVNEFIGYGSESLDGELSYHQRRNKSLITILERSLDEWLKNNIDGTIDYNNKVINVRDFLVEIATNEIYSIKQNLFRLYSENLDILYSKYGLTKEDFENDKLKHKIEEMFRKTIDILVQSPSNLITKEEEFIVKYDDVLKVKLDEITYDLIRKNFLDKIYNNDSSLYSIILQKVREVSKNDDIDESNFAFDKRVLEILKKKDDYLKRRIDFYDNSFDLQDEKHR